MAFQYLPWPMAFQYTRPILNSGEPSNARGSNTTSRDCNSAHNSTITERRLQQRIQQYHYGVKTATAHTTVPPRLETAMPHTTVTQHCYNDELYIDRAIHNTHPLRIPPCSKELTLGKIRVYRCADLLFSSYRIPRRSSNLSGCDFKSITGFRERRYCVGLHHIIRFVIFFTLGVDKIGLR